MSEGLIGSDGSENVAEVAPVQAESSINESYDGTRASMERLAGTGEKISPEKAAENQAARTAFKQ